jgi:hypothetical protein
MVHSAHPDASVVPTRLAVVTDVGTIAHGGGAIDGNATIVAVFDHDCPCSLGFLLF